uniref:Uncharacterized protein n=1 Tax=mine drainage metagenome TaxID=410659 RepID=E6Q5Q2_9ZZZZ
MKQNAARIELTIRQCSGSIVCTTEKDVQKVVFRRTIADKDERMTARKRRDSKGASNESPEPTLGAFSYLRGSVNSVVAGRSAPRCSISNSQSYNYRKGFDRTPIPGQMGCINE